MTRPPSGLDFLSSWKEKEIALPDFVPVVNKRVRRLQGAGKADNLWKCEEFQCAPARSLGQHQMATNVADLDDLYGRIPLKGKDVE
jgi:hypothetical protein